MRTTLVSIFLLLAMTLTAQTNMTPERLIELGRVSAMGISTDNNYIIYSVKTYNVAANKGEKEYFKIPVNGGSAIKIAEAKDYLLDDNISADGQYKLSSKEVKLLNVTGSDLYPDLKESQALIYDNLNYRHWDTWEDGKFDHVFLQKLTAIGFDEGIDLLKGEKYESPTKPFGGSEDYIWNPNGKEIVYVCKKKFGKEYAESTNTDLFLYNIADKTTKNITEGMMGYDLSPAFSTQGALAWLSMATDGFESDKIDVIVDNGGEKLNLTKRWDGAVQSFIWAKDGRSIYFIAPVDGTKQLFTVDYPGRTKKLPVVVQLTKGQFDVTSIVGELDNTLVVTRTDMNHATEIFSVSKSDYSFTQITSVNDAVYAKTNLVKVEKRYVTTTDGKQMLVWVILPPNFDATKKYPTLLYCQGGPQSALSQFYSFRWNFQMMASRGYIIVAPNRRGMPGHGVEWNSAISKDYGGQPMLDYFSAIDEISKESYVDNDRIGAIGASFGGYSVFQLAGTHQKRFKTFISHDGIFNWRSMYGTTEEMWFVNWDLGGAYWDKNETTERSYGEFNPVSHVAKWDTPIMVIQGGKDYRVPIGQGLEAFQVAQLKGLKSRLLYFPNENHWVLQTQNAIVWQREFFRWLKETL